MKKIRARQLRAAQIPASDDPDRDDLVLTLRGKPFALVLPVDAENLDITLKLARRMLAARALRSSQKRAAAARNLGRTPGFVDGCGWRQRLWLGNSQRL